MPKALLLENIHPDAAQSLRDHGFEVECLKGALSEDELIDALEGVDLLGIRSKTSVTRKVIDARPTLTAVGCFCIGTNQVDLEYAGKNGIAVFNAPYSNTRSVVELVIGDIICLMRRIPAHTHHMKHGMWDKSASGSHEVRGKTLGIIGYGNIGSQLSVVAEALGMRVLFYDIEEKLAMGNAHRCDTLNELLEQSDVVTLHVDGRKSNTGFFGEDQFEHMKQDAIFINLSRGFVADLDALKKHLDSGHLSGAAVDVFPIEPKKTGDEFLTDLADEDNMILTPHIGGSTLEAQKSIGQFVSQRLEDYWFKGSTMLSVNLPQITLSDIKSNFRIAHLHANLPGVLARVNRVLGEERVIVSNVAGTTRDAVDSEIDNKYGKYVFIDTAGIRRKSKVDERVEKFSVMRAQMAIERADVCIIMIDAREGVTEQDTKIAGLAHESGKASIIVVNKWDLVEKETGTMEKMRKEVMRDLSFMSYAPVLFISAKTGQRTDRIFELVNFVNDQSNMRITTGMLNDVLADAQARVQPPTDKGRRLKIYYMTQTGIKPPNFVIFCNSRELFHFSYQRYIENQIRAVFGLEGTPIRMVIRQKGDKQ